MIDAWGLAALLAGPALGAAAGEAADRWPHLGPMLAWRSRCACGARTRPLAELLLPGLDRFAVLRAAMPARTCPCSARPDSPSPLIDPALGLAGAGLAVLAARGPEVWAWAGLGWAFLFLARLDARLLALPAGAGLTLAGAGLIRAGAVDGPNGVAAAFAGALALWALLAGLDFGHRILRGGPGLGAADPPLAAGLGAWLGVVGGGWALALAAGFGLAWALSRPRRPERLPLAPLLAAGLGAVLLAQGLAS